MNNVMIPNDLRKNMLRVSELTPYGGNAKKHPEWQVGQIVNSIQAFGFNDPIAVWKDNAGHYLVVEGHGRLLAAQEMGLEEVPVIMLDTLDDEARRAYTLVHNKLTINTDFDLDMLDAELDNIEGFDMSEFGFAEELQGYEIDDSEDVAGDVFAKELDEAYNYIVLAFDKESDWEEAKEVFELEEVSTFRKNANVRHRGIGRVIEGAKVLERLEK